MDAAANVAAAPSRRPRAAAARRLPVGRVTVVASREVRVDLGRDYGFETFRPNQLRVIEGRALRERRPSRRGGKISG